MSSGGHINLTSIPLSNTTNTFNGHFLDIVGDNVPHNYNYKDYIRNSSNYFIYLFPYNESETKTYKYSLKSNA